MTTWQEAVDPAFVQLLMRPVEEPGVILPHIARSIMGPMAEMLSDFPLVEELFQRWMEAVDFPNEQLPIVYAQPQRAMREKETTILVEGRHDRESEGGSAGSLPVVLNRSDDFSRSVPPKTPSVVTTEGLDRREPPKTPSVITTEGLDYTVPPKTTSVVTTEGLDYMVPPKTTSVVTTIQEEAKRSVLPLVRPLKSNRSSNRGLSEALPVVRERLKTHQAPPSQAMPLPFSVPNRGSYSAKRAPAAPSQRWHRDSDGNSERNWAVNLAAAREGISPASKRTALDPIVMATKQPSIGNQKSVTSAATHEQAEKRVSLSRRDDEINVEQLVDQVHRKLMRQLAVESERRGGRRWA